MATPGGSRQDLRDSQRAADGDGGADPHAVRSGRPADHVADAVVAGSERRRADPHRRPGHHAAAARASPAWRRWTSSAPSSASWSSRSGRATCRPRASASRRSCRRCSRRTWRRRSGGSQGNSTSGRSGSRGGSIRRPTSSSSSSRSRTDASSGSATSPTSATRTEEPRSFALYNDEEAVGIDILKSTGFSTTAVAEQMSQRGSARFSGRCPPA